jgi:hypothetical protein
MTTRSYKKLCGIVDHVWDKWDDAVRRWTIYRCLGKSSELVKALTPSYSAHVHNTILNLFMIDSLREIGAVILDSDARSASLYRATKLLKSAGVTDSIREQYAIVTPPDHLNQEIDPAMRVHIEELIVARERERSLQEFADLNKKVVELTETIFDSAIAVAIRRTRNKAVAHYDVQEVGTEWRTVGIGDAGLTMGDMEDYISKCTEAVSIVTVFVQRKSMDFAEARKIHEKYAAEYIDAIVRGRRSQQAEIVAKRNKGN